MCPLLLKGGGAVREPSGLVIIYIDDINTK